MRRDVDDVIVVEVQTGDGEVRFRLCWLLLDGDRHASGIQLDHAVSLRIVNAIGEYTRARRARRRAPQEIVEPRAEEDVVAQYQRNRVTPDKLSADGEGLGQPFRLGLNLVFDVHAKLRAVAEQSDIVVDILRRGDDQNVPDLGQHQYRQRVVDHRLVVDRQQLLVHGQRRRMQARA